MSTRNGNDRYRTDGRGSNPFRRSSMMGPGMGTGPTPASGRGDTGRGRSGRWTRASQSSSSTTGRLHQPDLHRRDAPSSASASSPSAPQSPDRRSPLFDLEEDEAPRLRPSPTRRPLNRTRSLSSAPTPPPPRELYHDDLAGAGSMDDLAGSVSIGGIDGYADADEDLPPPTLPHPHLRQRTPPGTRTTALHRKGDPEAYAPARRSGWWGQREVGWMYRFWYHHQLLALTIIALLSIVVVVLFWPAPGSGRPGQWLGPIGQVFPLPLLFPRTNPQPASEPEPAPHLPGDYHLQGPPSLTAGQIDAILASYHSPATGTGRVWVSLGHTYHIDPAFALAFFIHESSAGTHPAWAGHKPGGATTHNIGNIICAGYPRCHGRFRDYASWEEGIEDWYRLIADEYISGRGAATVDEIVPIYAPAVENNVQAYTTAIKQMVDDWRSM